MSSSTVISLTCIIHEDSAPRVNSAKQVALSPEKRGPPRAEGDKVRCDALARTIHEMASIIAQRFVFTVNFLLAANTY